MEIDEVIARAEITDVLARYARGVDRADWDLVRACYHPDATDDHGLFNGDVDGLIGFLQRLAARLVSTTHQLGNVVIDWRGDAAATEAYCLGWYRRSARTGDELMVVQGLRYLDLLERRQGRWAIASRVVVLDWEHVMPLSDQAAIPSTWQRGARAGADPSSGHLAAIVGYGA